MISNDLEFRTKLITFFGVPKTIILQNHNGPCPLLAIANCLVLTNRISFIGETFVPASSIVSKIAELVLSTSTNSTNINALRLQLDCILTHIPLMSRGLDLNVKFTSVKAFEFTSDIHVFDALNIDLFHVWLVDPQDQETYSIIETMSINQVYDFLVKSDVAEDTLKRSSYPKSIVQNVLNHIAAENSSGRSSPCQEESLDPDQVNDLKEVIRRGEVLRSFLAQSKSHITHFGLFQLHADVKERQLAVLYRNAHFSTIFKYNGKIYSLVSDEGYQFSDLVVWENVSNIDGDTDYCDAEFRQHQAFLNIENKKTQCAPHSNLPAVCPDAANVQGDLNIALFLQQQENEAALRKVPMSESRLKTRCCIS